MKMKNGFKLVFLFFLILYTVNAYAYKNAEFPGVGNIANWQNAYSIYKNINSYNPDIAVPKIKQAIAIYPYDGTFYYALSRYSKDTTTKIKYLQEAQQLKLDEPQINFLLGKLYYKNHDYNKSIGCLNKYLLVKSKGSEALYYLGLDYDKTGHYNMALKAFQNMNLINPTSDGYYAIGQEYAKLGKYDSSIDVFRKASSINPKDHKIYDARLSLANKYKDYGEIRACEKQMSKYFAHDRQINKSMEQTNLLFLCYFIGMFWLIFVILNLKKRKYSAGYNTTQAHPGKDVLTSYESVNGTNLEHNNQTEPMLRHDFLDQIHTKMEVESGYHVPVGHNLDPHIENKYISHSSSHSIDESNVRITKTNIQSLGGINKSAENNLAPHIDPYVLESHSGKDLNINKSVNVSADDTMPQSVINNNEYEHINDNPKQNTALDNPVIEASYATTDTSLPTVVDSNESKINLGNNFTPNVSNTFLKGDNFEAKPDSFVKENLVNQFDANVFEFKSSQDSLATIDSTLGYSNENNGGNEESVNNPNKLCSNCGKELDLNFSFCIYCSKIID